MDVYNILPISEYKKTEKKRNNSLKIHTVVEFEANKRITSKLI